MRIFMIILCLFIMSGFSNVELETDIQKVDFKLLEGEIAITFLNLTNGEATLLQNANGENILINTGGQGTAKELAYFLDIYGVDSLKSIIITKVEDEYAANIDWLLKKYPDSTLIVGKHSVNSLVISHRNVIQWEKSDPKNIWEDLTIEVISEGSNEKEVIGMDLLLTYGSHKVLFMTNSNSQLERHLIKNNHLKDVSILKVADFGSEKGTSLMFIEIVHPQAAVIFRKEGVLPSQDVVERLYETWIDIYYTKQFGNVSAICDEEEMEIITIPNES